MSYALEVITTRRQKLHSLSLCLFLNVVVYYISRGLLIIMDGHPGNQLDGHHQRGRDAPKEGGLGFDPSWAGRLTLFFLFIYFYITLLALVVVVVVVVVFSSLFQ